MKWLKNTISFLNGKKTIIGTAILLSSMGAQAFFPSLLSPEQFNFIDMFGATLSGAGLLHKGVKGVQQIKNKTDINKN